MTGGMLEFSVLSGGTVAIDRTKCPTCASKACLEVCSEQGGPLVLDAARDIPRLRASADEAREGGCVECLGCELACDLLGHQAVTITLPLVGFDDYLGALAEPVVYEREW